MSKGARLTTRTAVEANCHLLHTTEVRMLSYKHRRDTMTSKISIGSSDHVGSSKISFSLFLALLLPAAEPDPVNL